MMTTVAYIILKFESMIKREIVANHAFSTFALRGETFAFSCFLDDFTEIIPREKKFYSIRESLSHAK